MDVSIKGVQFRVTGEPYPAYWEQLGSGEWELETFSIIEAFVKESAIAIDLGCWAGPVSLFLSGKGAIVYAIDPDPEAFRILEENRAMNPELAERIQTFPLAIGPDNSSALLYARNKYGLSSTSLLNRVRDEVGSVRTKCVRLNDFLLENKLESIDFMKVDIEGSEFRIGQQLIDARQVFGCKTMLLSVHYDQLNESIFKQRIRNKGICKLLMKLESLIGVRFFRKELLANLESIVELGKCFNHVYTISGKDVTNSISAEFLLRSKLDLLFTSTKWSVSASK